MTRQQATDTLRYMLERCPYNDRMQEALQFALHELSQPHPIVYRSSQ